MKCQLFHCQCAAAMIPSLLLGLLLTSPFIVVGEYDTLSRRSDVLVPPKIRALRDQMTSLLEPGMYQELMFNVMSYIAPTDSDNPLCNNHSTQLQMGFLQDELWAVKMMDAGTKLPAGTMVGAMQDLGDYEECLGVQGPRGQFSGQLCLVQTSGLMPPIIPNPKTSEISITQPLDVEVVFAACVPDSCSPRDVSLHWQSVMEEFNASASVSELDCSTKHGTTMTSRALIALFVLAVLTALVLGSTFYDYYVNHEPTKDHRILTSFSLYKTLGQLQHPEDREYNFPVLDVYQSVATAWILLAHRFEYCLQVPQDNMIHTEKYATAWFMAPVLNFILSVEMYFLVTASLTTFHFLKERARGDKFNLWHFYFKRLVKVTPSLAMVVMVEGCLMFFVSEGPLWKRLIGFRQSSCVTYWWSSLLYISNYVAPFRTCVLQTWYQSAEMQLYLLSPLLLLPLAKSPRKGLLLIAACYLATTIDSFFNAYSLRLPAGVPVELDHKAERTFGYAFVRTHTRAGSWLTGMVLGFILHQYKDEQHTFKISKTTAGVCWVVSLVLCVSAVFSIVPIQSLEYKYDPVIDSLHIALHRNIFALGAAGVVLLCVFREQGLLTDVLSWRGFRLMSALSYGMFLDHMGIQLVSLARITRPLSFDMYSLFLWFMSDMLFCGLLATLLFTFVEAPFCSIGDWLYNPKTKTWNVEKTYEKTRNGNVRC